jgi:competence protein ComEC
VVLLMLDPGLGRSAGFVLSVLATGGILVLAAPLRDAMVVWMPRWLAEAIAVPFAAQLACTPVVAAISGRVSLVAVAANMLAAPAVGPATVLGLAGGVLGLLHDPLGRVPGTMASWCVAWIATVAERGADLPTAAIAWSESWPGIAALSLVAAVTAIGSLRVVRHRGPTIALTGVLVAVVLVRPGGLLPGGWLPDDWVVVACDVGQGDAVAVRAGPEAAVVVDAGPDPTLVDRCLAEIGVNAVPLLVLTHFHADHVDGLDGVLAGRRVGAVEVTTTLDPPGGVRDVLGVAEERRVAPAYAAAGPARVFGTATVQALWPPAGAPRPGPGDGSAANDASVVLLVEVEGIRILLTGDVEPLSQGRLARAYPGLRVDVLKMPHHGSRYQDLDWLASLGAETVLVSVGADNDYGHPAADALAALSWAGSEVFRTDRSGHLAVVVREGRPRVVAQR